MSLDQKIQRAIVIHPRLKTPDGNPTRHAESRLEEAVGLAHAIDLEIVLAQVVPLQRIIPATYIGTGKLEYLMEYAGDNPVDLVIIDTALSPIQQRNLETKLECKVIDRTALILEIFGARAQTREGSLQVELASYEYQKSRLVRSWTHLERQRGGGGFMGGPGEKQIESDRRALNERITLLKRQLNKVVKTRELHRKSRKATPYPIVSLVGYTNAGKSTLFNHLTGANVFAKDQLFATLDPTMRVIRLPSGREVMLSDTVGFISDLPTELVAAFRATLEEVIEADIILHVRDIAHDETADQKRDVEHVLEALGVGEETQKAMIEVHNKIDLLGGDIPPNSDDRIMLSALTGQGTEALLTHIDSILAKKEQQAEVTVSSSDGKTLAWIHAHATIITQHQDEDAATITFSLELSTQNQGRLFKMLGIKKEEEDF